MPRGEPGRCSGVAYTLQNLRPNPTSNVWPSAGGKLTLLIARVCLGRCQVIDHARNNLPFLPEVEGKTTLAVPVLAPAVGWPGWAYK